MAIVLDLSHTSHCPSHTGVQRVCRQILAGLHHTGAAPTALIFDRYAGNWRLPDADEAALLLPAAAEQPGIRRGEAWSFHQKLRGWFHFGTEPDWPALYHAPLFVPEIFSPRSFAAYGTLRANLAGAATAFFHDAVVLRHPELSPAANVARFPAYLSELATFDAIAANSHASRNELLDYWDKEGRVDHPPVTALPLAVDPPGLAPTMDPRAPDARGPLILSVGTIEGRKNHLALLEAAEFLWREGRQFRLTLAGLHRTDTASDALRLAALLKSAGRPLEFPGAVAESQLEQLYAACQFTVYPSIYEGFGLPVAESLVRQRPCICGPGGALAEVAEGGGCLLVAAPTPTNLAEAMRNLLTDQALHRRLVAEACQRRFPTWNEYAQKLMAWLASVRPRARS